MLVRTVSALPVLALLALAAAAPPPMMPAPPPPLVCELPLVEGAGDGSVDFQSSLGLIQPLPPAFAAAACSLGIQGLEWTNGHVDIVQWDPLTLAPDPTTIALRTILFSPSSMQYYTINRVPRVDLVPPLVTRSVEGVAEPPRQTTAVAAISFSTMRGYFDPSSPTILPGARVGSPSGGSVALPGSHPVVMHSFCPGDADLQTLRIAQSVMRTDVKLSASPAELLQRFRVPEPVELRWIELAIGTPAVQNYIPATVGIVDGEGLALPLQTMPSTLTEGYFAQYVTDYYFGDIPRWASHLALDRSIVLQPFHDYWLSVRSATSHGFYARTLTGAEGASFTAGVGPFYTRATDAEAWAPAANQALDFRVVGRPLSSAGVTPPARAAAFALRVSPNPAPSMIQVSWSGAVGPVKLEVLDARGRRVATGEGGAAGTWRMARGSTPLPAGVYFVNARDSAGDHAVDRVVIVR